MPEHDTLARRDAYVYGRAGWPAVRALRHARRQRHPGALRREPEACLLVSALPAAERLICNVQ
jgi:hypothetical protein